MNKNIATILSNTQIARDIWQMDLYQAKDTMVGFKPGRFVHVKIPNAGQLILRRPFGINSYNPNDGTFSIVYQVKGEGTTRLAMMKPEGTIEYMGPLGNGFSILSSAKNVYIVGGGLGLAPLRSVVESYPDIHFSVFLGFRSKEYAYQTDIFERLCDHVFVATDDGSLGEKGLITNVLTRELKLHQPDLLLVCGPTVMAKAIKTIIKDYGQISCQVSLEERMACGVGACRGCVCRIGKQDNWHYQQVCKDGPVFDLREVIFDDEFAG